MAAQLQTKRASAALRLAERQRFPDVSVGAQYTQEGSGVGAITPPTLSLLLTAPLPIFYRQAGEIERAKADLRLQQITAAKTEAQITADVLEAVSSFTTAKAQVDRFNARLLERAKTARDLVSVQYEKGAASLLDLLDAERSYLSVNADYLQDLANLHIATYLLEQSVGMELKDDND